MNEEQILKLIDDNQKMFKVIADDLQNQINQIRLKMDKIYERLK